jgi:hypothetical protein
LSHGTVLKISIEFLETPSSVIIESEPCEVWGQCPEWLFPKGIYTQRGHFMKLILQIIFMPYKLFLLLKLRRAEAKLEKIEAEIVDWLIINDRIQSRIRELALEQAELN